MSKGSYAQLVNLHLTIAQDHIDRCSTESRAQQHRGLVISCQYHLYLVTVFYLREIAAAMLLPDVDSMLTLNQLQSLLNSHNLANGCVD